MRAWRRAARSLAAEARLLGAALRDWRPFAALALFAALMLAAAQAPLRSTIEVGLEEGYGSDRPMVAQFHDPEISTFAGANFRWTTGQSLIRLPGVGGRPLKLAIRLLPIDPSIAAQSPRSFELWANGARLGSVAVRPTGGETFAFLLPPASNGSADQVVEIRSATFTPAGDRRAIGLPVEQVRVESLGGPAWPDARETLSWLAAAGLLWLSLRRIGLGPRAALALLLPAILLASLAALLDPPRFAFGATTALIAAALGWLLALLMAAEPPALLAAGLALAAIGALARLAAPQPDWSPWAAPLAGGLALALAGWLRPELGRRYERLAPPIPAGARRWLMLFAVAVLVTHYGGKIYPDAMWGDIGFHSNRYQEVLDGTVLLISRNRGVDFPYPPAFYLLIAPLALAGLSRAVLLQLGGALLNALSPFVVYAIAVQAGHGRWTEGESRVGDLPSSSFRRHSDCDTAWRRGVVAAGIYSFAAATLMTTWWNFSTHIFSQFAHLVLIAALVLLCRRPTANQRPKTKDDEDQRLTQAAAPWSLVPGPWSLAGLVVLQSLLYLGHFGFWMNMSLLGAGGLAVLLIAAWRGRASWRLFWRLLAAYTAAELFAVLFFYGAYAGLFLAQARTAASGGLTAVQGKDAVDRAALWRSLWDAGFRVHFGFFPVPLALGGLALLWPRAASGERRAANDERTRMLSVSYWTSIILVVGTFAVALLFGALPFATRAALSTRWLMFSAWAVAVCAAPVARKLWRSGLAGRWVTLAMGAYIFWVTASMWLGALAYRIRPPEPF